MSYLFWFLAAAVLIVLELLTTSLVFASFAFGAIFAGITGLLNFDLVGQGLIFSLASVLAVFFLRPLFSKRFETRASKQNTNVMAVVGSQATVVEQVSKTTGLVKLKGESWSARSEGAVIEPLTTVTVKDIDGVTLIVETKED